MKCFMDKFNICNGLPFGNILHYYLTSATYHLNQYLCVSVSYSYSYSAEVKFGFASSFTYILSFEMAVE